MHLNLFPYSTAMVPTKTVLIICSHYIIRKGCESAALFSVSPAVFRGYVTSVWTLFDILAIFLTMAAFLWHERNPGRALNGFNAFVLGLLWIKVLGLLKIVNEHMSSFILALLEILSDLRIFIIVLLVFIFMFGDMFHLYVRMLVIHCVHKSQARYFSLTVVPPTGR